MRFVGGRRALHGLRRTISAPIVVTPPSYRYYRVTITKNAGNSTSIYMQMSEWAFYSDAGMGARVFASAVTTPDVTWADGGVAALNDNDTATKGGTMGIISGGTSKSFTYDFGTPKALMAYNWATANDTAATPARNPVSWVIEASTDNATWLHVATVNDATVVSTNFTWQSGWSLFPAAPSLAGDAGNAQNTIYWAGNSLVPSRKIYRGTASGALSLLGTTAEVSAYGDLGVSNGTAYYYKVSNLNAAGFESALSNEVSLTPTTAVTVNYDPAAVALFARSGSSFTAAEKQATSHAIKAMRGVGMWSGMTTFVAAGGDLTKSLLNWTGYADPTLTGTVNFTANGAFTGDGTTGGMDLKVGIPNQNAAFIGFRTNSNVATDAYDMAGGGTVMRLKSTGSQSSSMLQSSSQVFGGVPADTTGTAMIGRSSSSRIDLYHNGGQIAGATNGSVAPSGTLGAMNVWATFSARPYAAFFAGGGWNAGFPRAMQGIIDGWRNSMANPRAASTSGKTSGISANRTYEPATTRSITVPYTFQTTHFVSPQANMTKIAPIWNGWYRNADLYRNTLGADVTIEASVEYPAGSGTFTPLTFAGGSTSGVVTNGGVLKADLLTIAIPAGAQFRIRTVVTAISSSTFVPCYQYILAPNATSYADGGASGNLKTSGTITAAAESRIWGPIAIMGELDAANCRGFVLHGTSSGMGTGDTSTGPKGGTGYLQRAVDPLYPWVGLLTPGATEINGTRFDDMTKLYLLAAAMNSLGGVSDVITQGGTNDFTNQSKNADELAGFQRCYSSLWAGARHIRVTMTPYSTSTDGWLTAANQTVTTLGTYSAQMPTYNANMRAGVGVGDVYGVIDAATIASSATDSGKWKDASPAWTTDGLHPNGTGHAAIAAAITIP